MAGRPGGAGRARRGAVGAVALVLVVVGAVAAIGVLVDRSVVPFLPRGEKCTAEVGGRTVVLDRDQAENASLIAATAVRRGMPARAASIALATAYQESKIRNLDHGDRDSVGLFQQRPSQGWGTVAQLTDPEYATNAFYDELEEVPGYRDMRITEAAQRVQRSAFPEAYADHEDDARVLASALTGRSHAAFWCEGAGVPDDGPTALDASGLTERAAAVRRDLDAVFGRQSVGGFAPGGVTTGHQPGSAHYEGRAVDVFTRPVTEASQDRGWAIAQYLVAHADRLHVATVIYDAKIWTARRDAQGWRTYTVGRDRPGDRDILLHRDHVHVDVG